jgi:hypothetical protein
MGNGNDARIVNRLRPGISDLLRLPVSKLVLAAQAPGVAGRSSSVDTGNSSFFLYELPASVPALSPLNNISFNLKTKRAS